MRTVDVLIALLWLAFWAYWLVSARTAKPAVRRSTGFIGIRVLLALVLIAVIRGGLLGRHSGGLLGGHSGVRTLAWGIAGLVLLVLGLSLAVWARVYLGRNWGMPMSRKLEPELVTTGPYRTVRHPIYTGIVLGTVGTAIATSGYALVPAVLLGGYFVHSARVEERYLADRFPASYPQYRSTTKMLIPFVY